MCLLEGTNLSEGRGTTKPFEIWGAPWLDGQKLADDLEKEKLPGVKFRPCAFTPTWDKHKGARCHGVQIHIDDARKLEPVKLGVACIVHARNQHKLHFKWRTEKYEFVDDKPAIDLLTGSAKFRESAEQGASVDELCAPWISEKQDFLQRRQGALLYG
jgi:uncharacterized protein YbbC (DUF1343 family)